MNFQKIREQPKTLYIDYISTENMFVSSWRGEETYFQNSVFERLWFTVLQSDSLSCRVKQNLISNLLLRKKTITPGILQRNSINYTFCNEIALVNNTFVKKNLMNIKDKEQFARSNAGHLYRLDRQKFEHKIDWTQTTARNGDITITLLNTILETNHRVKFCGTPLIALPTVLITTNGLNWNVSFLTSDQSDQRIIHMHRHHTLTLMITSTQVQLVEMSVSL